MAQITERVLITGASRGIGRAIAGTLAAEHRELIITGRDQEALVEVFTELEDACGKVTILTHDLGDPDDVDELVAKIGKEPLHLLVNNAGIAIVKPLEDITYDDWQDTLDINVTAPFLLTQKLVPLMPEGASIVNILSVAAKTVFPGWSSYIMSKYAQRGFAEAIREELRPKGIRVINVYPAATNTEIWEDVAGDFDGDKMMSPDEVAAAVMFALERPANILVDDISLGRLEGNQ
ncbi:SDR family NAD(P)-dependent oxidoreductase [candidate division GN15 bacterium]|nr:SDR family NAD(P)-dependent oxidoreductase [candidate division GN15 bacterium]